MENQNPSPAPQQSSSAMKYAIPVAVIAIIVIAAIFFFTQNKSTPAPTQEVAEQTVPPTEAPAVSTSPYADGTYAATGEYLSPGGERTVDVTITLQDGIISDSTFVGNATDATSKRFQGEFGDGYKEMIVGKNIDEVNLTKVAGSSLTPKGFADALEKIKADAQS